MLEDVHSIVMTGLEGMISSSVSRHDREGGMRE
jgi:hypothetical protein